MTYSTYKKTATRSQKDGRVYCFGRRSDLDGRDVDLGGYVVFVVKSNYSGLHHGGMDKHLVAVETNLSFSAAKELMNKKVGYVAF